MRQFQLQLSLDTCNYQWISFVTASVWTYLSSTWAYFQDLIYIIGVWVHPPNRRYLGNRSGEPEVIGLPLWVIGCTHNFLRFKAWNWRVGYFSNNPISTCFDGPFIDILAIMKFLFPSNIGPETFTSNLWKRDMDNMIFPFVVLFLKELTVEQPPPSNFYC